MGALTLFSMCMWTYIFYVAKNIKQQGLEMVLEGCIEKNLYST